MTHARTAKADDPAENCRHTRHLDSDHHNSAGWKYASHLFHAIEADRDQDTDAVAYSTDRFSQIADDYRSACATDSHDFMSGLHAAANHRFCPHP